MDNSGPAFPSYFIPPDDENTAWRPILPGLTKREAFAMAAMQGMLSCQDLMNETLRGCASKVEARERVSTWAFVQADAMLRESERGAKDE